MFGGMEQPENPPRQRLLRPVLAAALLLAALALVLLKWTPAVYERTAIIGPDPAAQARFNEEVVNRIGNVLLDRSGGTRLDLAVTEEMVNARIAGFLADEQGAGRPLPPVVRDLRLGFEPGAVVVVTRIGRGLSRLVVSQTLCLEVQPDGALRIRPGCLWVGALPVPSVFLGEVRQAVAERLAQESSADDDKSIDLGRYVVEALGGSPVFLGKGRKRILADHIEIQAGLIRIEGHRADAPNPP